MAEELEVRTLADGSSLTRDREGNALDATGGDAAMLLACARHVARLAPQEAARWWRGEDATAQVSLELLRWAIEGAYAEHLGDFTRWMFAAPPRACIAGDGDRDAAASLEPVLARFAAEVAGRTLPAATETAREAKTSERSPQRGRRSGRGRRVGVERLRLRSSVEAPERRARGRTTAGAPLGRGGEVRPRRSRSFPVRWGRVRAPGAAAGPAGRDGGGSCGRHRGR